jgi:16S rRNA U1498 N3-methylase RsmE
MPAGRFVVTGMALAEGAEITLPPEIAHQARDVLRLAPGDRLWLLDGAGDEYPAELVVVERGRVTARLGARRRHGWCSARGC